MSEEQERLRLSGRDSTSGRHVPAGSDPSSPKLVPPLPVENNRQPGEIPQSVRFSPTEKLEADLREACGANGALESRGGPGFEDDAPTRSLSQGIPSGPSPAGVPRIPDFDLIRQLGKGGFGQVWLARSRAGVYRAVKVLARSQYSDIEFAGIRAYEVHARGHRNLVSIFHIGETWLYYVMDGAGRWLRHRADVSDRGLPA